MADDKVLSLLLDAELDSVGFGKIAVKHRVEMYEKRSKAKAAATRKILKCEHVEKIIVGSRRDGIATETSDTDVMQINHVIACSTNSLDFENEDEKVCLLLECDSAPPGYGFLSVNKCDGSNAKHSKDIESAVVHRRNKMYVSSNEYMTLMTKQQTTFRRGWFGKNVEIGARKGPAIPKTLTSLGFESDLVGAFQISCGNILKRWRNKERQYDWPSEEVVKRAADLPVYVVAVGKHGSEDEDLQWRISFNNAEMVLVQSLNDSQTKILVMMRLLAKYRLTPVCSDITSYVIKNIVLHVAEQHPLKDFQRDTLIDRFKDCMRYLKNCIEKRHLPNYINPERNVFDGKLMDTSEVEEAIHVIDDVMKEGKDGLLFYLINRTRPEMIRKEYPMIYALKVSLTRGNIEDRFAQKKVKAMTLEQLTDLHIHDDQCSFQMMLFINDLNYIYRPYVSKYGIRALVSDLNKIRLKYGTGNAAFYQGDEMFTEENYEVEEKVDELDVSGERSADTSGMPHEIADDLDRSNDVDASAVNEDPEQDQSEIPEANEEAGPTKREPNGVAGHLYRIVTVLVNTLLWSSILITKFMLLNVLNVIHMLLIFFIWYSLRQFVPAEITNYTDMAGLLMVVFVCVSFIKKRISQMFNVFYIALLFSIWRSYMSFPDTYTLYFHELIVMLDPRQSGLHNLHRTDLNIDDMDDFYTRRTMFA